LVVVLYDLTEDLTSAVLWLSLLLLLMLLPPPSVRLSSGEHVTFPVIISTGQLGRCCSSLTRGRGRRRIAGGWDEKGNEAAQVAISVVALNAKRLRAWATGEAAGRGSWGLFNSLQDLSVCDTELDVDKMGYSAAACVALSLVCLLGGRMCAEHLVAVTGDIDLRGRVLEVGGIREKLEVLQRRRLRRLIIPETTHKELEASGEMEKEWPAELRDFGRKVMGTASNLVELMAVCMPGESSSHECPRWPCHTLTRLLRPYALVLWLGTVLRQA
jgi:hypothetical protein